MNTERKVVDLLDQQLEFAVVGEDLKSIRMDLIEAETTIEHLYEHGKRAQTKKYGDYLEDLCQWVKATHGVELTITQAWTMERQIRSAFAAYKKKLDTLLASDTSTESTSSPSAAEN